MHYVCSLENIKYFKLFQVEGRKAIHLQFQKYQQKKSWQNTRKHLNTMKNQKNIRNESKNQAELRKNGWTLVST